MKQVLAYIEKHKSFIKKIIYFAITLIIYKLFSLKETQDALKILLDSIFATTFICIGGHK